MTTAHRPTWKAAVAKESGGWTAGGAISTQRSVLDAPAHTRLKFRDASASNNNDKDQRLRESLQELEQAEREQQKLLLASGRYHGSRQQRLNHDELQERARQKLLTHTTDAVDLEAIKRKYDDSDVEDDDDDDSDDIDDVKRRAKKTKNGNNNDDDSDLDADNDSDLDASSTSSNSDDDDDDDDDDDEAALQAELAKIRAEREAAKAVQDDEQLAQDQDDQQQAALTGNPLLNINSAVATSNIKKRSWTEESVFSGQAKNEPKPVKRFINDTVRNDFHKRFLNKFIR